MRLQLMMTAALLLPWMLPAHAPGGDPPSSLEEVIENFREAWEGGLSERSEKYVSLNAAAAEKIQKASGGRWWVVGFGQDGHPRWVRGILEREETVFDGARALLEAGRVKATLQETMGWSRKKFAPAAVREDHWTYTIEYQQTHQDRPIDGARLGFRFLKEYRRETGSPEQWNLEVRDHTLAQPRGLYRPEIPAGQALELGDPPGDPTLLFCPGIDDEGPVYLCWKVETGLKAYHVDAVGGPADENC